MITSNSIKFDHIRFLCDLNNVEAIRVPIQYAEIQENDMTKLLSSIVESLVLPDDRAIWAIEQTAVFFKALNGVAPGYFFKDWWNNRTKDDLRTIVETDPRAYIESGLALIIPNHDPVIFVNRQAGKISASGSGIEENKEYSWLSANDFNCHFVPKRAKSVYDSLPIGEFIKYDFRKPNVDKACERLSEYRSIISSKISLELLSKLASEYMSKPMSQTDQQRIDERWDPGQ